MVMDNDDTNHRHGLEQTYKKEKGFQPLQMTCARFIIDAVFRQGTLALRCCYSKGLPPMLLSNFILLIAFPFLFDTFKEDVCAGVVPLGAYPTTLSRKVMDVAATNRESLRRAHP